MDTIGISGLVVSVAGFGISIWQLYRTRKAAEAAMVAARDAVQSLKLTRSIATIQEICGRSRNLLSLARDRNLASAAIAAFELRDSVVQFRATDIGKNVCNADTWSITLEKTRTIHERLETASMTNRIDANDRATLIHDISDLHTQLSSFASTATDSGAEHANTK